MNSHAQLNPTQPNPAQIEDLRNRLASFQKHGIMLASSAYSEFKHVITASERSAKEVLCVNSVDLEQNTTQAICDALITHETHGFLNMAIERHNFIECKDQDEFKIQIGNRLRSSFVFIMDSAGIGNPTNISRKVEYLPKGIVELMLSKNIDAKYICGILAPSGIEQYFAQHFKEIPIYVAPLQYSDLTLPTFTLSTAICCTDDTNKATHIIVPDYEHALRQFIKMNPARKKFLTHISRFATPHDLQHPFSPLTDAQRIMQERAHMQRMHKKLFASQATIDKFLLQIHTEQKKPPENVQLRTTRSIDDNAPAAGAGESAKQYMCVNPYEGFVCKRDGNHAGIAMPNFKTCYAIIIVTQDFLLALHYPSRVYSKQLSNGFKKWESLLKGKIEQALIISNKHYANWGSATENNITNFQAQLNKELGIEFKIAEASGSAEDQLLIVNSTAVSLRNNNDLITNTKNYANWPIHPTSRLRYYTCRAQFFTKNDDFPVMIIGSKHFLAPTDEKEWPALVSEHVKVLKQKNQQP